MEAPPLTLMSCPVMWIAVDHAPDVEVDLPLPFAARFVEEGAWR